jgi:hypothetical protein
VNWIMEKRRTKQLPRVPDRDLRLAREELHGPRRPRWMQSPHILGTAIGPKLVKGKPTSTSAIHIFVRTKKANRALGSGDKIPRAIAGLPVDVVRSGGEVAQAAHVTAPTPVGVTYGTSVISASGEVGRVSCCGVLSGGKVVVLTSGHVLQQGEQGFLPAFDNHLLGVCVFERDYASGAELYGSWANDPQERFSLDVSVVEPAPDLRFLGGLPWGQSFTVADDTQHLTNGLVGSTAVVQGALGMRHGIVHSLWPRRATGTATGLCSIQPTEGPPPIPGDSGGLWLVRDSSSQGFAALGLHWGTVADMAFVSDITGALPLIEVQSLMTTP